MAKFTLEETYEDIYNSLLFYVKKTGIENPELYTQFQIFTVLNTRFWRLSHEMKSRGAVTLVKGMLPLIPDDKEKSNFTQLLIDYHNAEKLAIRKYRSATKQEIKEIDIIEMFELTLEKTKNFTETKID